MDMIKELFERQGVACAALPDAFAHAQYKNNTIRWRDIFACSFTVLAHPWHFILSDFKMLGVRHGTAL